MIRGLRGRPIIIASALVATGAVVWTLKAQTRETGRPIVMLGDSLTEQGDWTKRYAPLDVRNRGVGGEGAGDLLRRLDRIVAERPAAVFLMAGVNDLKTGTPPDVVLRDIKEIAARLQREGIPLVFQSTVLINPARRPEINGSIRALNEQIRALARDAGLPFYDLNSALASDGWLADDMTRDGLHLTGKGYAAWGQVIDACLRSVGSGQPAHSCPGSSNEPGRATRPD